MQGHNGPDLKREHDAPQYKLNNVCDPKRVRKPHWGGAQITEHLLYTTIYCGCQYEIVDILCFLVDEKTNTHYLRIKCVLRK